MATPREPQDHKPARKRAAAKKAAPATVSDSDRIAAEAETLDIDWYTVDMGGRPARIKPYLDWPRNTWQRMQRTADFDAFTALMHPDDVEIWLDWDCTLGQIGDLITEIITAAGQEPGESRASNAFSRPTLRR